MVAWANLRVRLFVEDVGNRNHVLRLSALQIRTFTYQLPC